jgi:molybdopterin converting factor small subunit
MTLIRVPPTLRSETGGRPEVTARGETVRELLEDLGERFPSLAAQLFTDGELARYVNVYVDGEDVRTQDGLETHVADDARVILLPAVAGG